MLRFETRIIYGVFSILLSCRLLAGDCPSEGCDGDLLPAARGEYYCPRCEQYKCSNDTRKAVRGASTLVLNDLENVTSTNEYLVPEQEPLNVRVRRLIEQNNEGQEPTVMDCKSKDCIFEFLTIPMLTEKFSPSKDIKVHSFSTYTLQHAISILKVLSAVPDSFGSLVFSSLVSLAYISGHEGTIDTNTEGTLSIFIRALIDVSYNYQTNDSMQA